MASVNNNWYFNSLILKFLTTPFRIAWIFLVILVIVFGVSTVTQTYYHQPNLLQQEIEQLKQVGTKPILRRNNEAGSASINIWVSEQSYRALYALFFQLTQIEDAFYAQNESDKGYRLKQYLIKHQEAVKRFDETLKIMSIRIGNISLFIGLAIILTVLAIIDGLTMRSIRQKNASRESAAIYHRAKYWRVGINWTSILLYLCLPIVISPYIILIPIILGALMTYLQAKYLKKYL